MKHLEQDSIILRLDDSNNHFTKGGGNHLRKESFLGETFWPS